MTDRVLVIGVGDELLGDDGVGPGLIDYLAKHCAEREIELRAVRGESTQLLEAWEDRPSVILVDALRSGRRPGTIVRFGSGDQRLSSAHLGSSSTHAMGLREAIGLAGALHRLPPRLVVFAVEGGQFEAGTGLSDEVRAALPELAERVISEAARLSGH